jgi:hypothetical protein
MECTQELLDKYSLEHYTYVNQIFGDATVREIIEKVFRNKKNKDSTFFVEEVPEHGLFERGYHHLLVNKKNNEETVYCSVASRHQVPHKNIHDTLCQTYSIMKYLDKPLDEIFDDESLNERQKMYKVHYEMIKMYREMIENPRFLREFNTIDFVNTFDEDGRTRTFRNFTRKNNPALNLSSEKILSNFKKILDKWETYGYWHFIGTGKCHKGRLIHKLTDQIKRITNKTRKYREKITDVEDDVEIKKPSPVKEPEPVAVQVPMKPEPEPIRQGIAAPVPSVDSLVADFEKMSLMNRSREKSK